ncbi:hypothetical protein PO909_011279 [Leuciscus waleckii]
MILEKKCIGFAVPITDAHQMEFRSGLKENSRDKTRPHNVPSVGLIDRPMAPARTNQQPSSPSCHASSLYGNCWFNPFHQPRSPAAIPTVTSDLDA